MRLTDLAIILAAYLLLCGAARGQTPPAIKWVAAGTSTQPAGVPVPLTPDVIAAVQAALRPTTLPATPTTRPTPPLTQRRQLIATGNPRGNGADARIGLYDAYVYGYEQNVVRLSGGAGSISNAIILNSFRRAAKDKFVGQAVYIEKCGPTTISNVAIGWSGWQPDKPETDRNGYRHGIYHQYDAGPLLVEDSVIFASSGFGANLRNDATIRNCIFIDNGVGIGAIGGHIRLEHVTIYQGHRYVEVDGNGKILSHTGDVGLQIYTDTIADDVWIVGAVGQAAKKAHEYDLGAVITSRKYNPHPEWQTPGGGKLHATNCMIAGWPGPSFAGDARHDGSGFTIKPSSIGYDPNPVLNAMLAGKISPKDAAAKLSADVRSAVK